MAGIPFKRLLNTYPNARIAVEIAFGANLADLTGASWVWTDVTTDVRFTGKVTITPMGRSDEAGKAQPAGCAFTLDNDSGDYSKGPTSIHYPYVRDNTPVRVRVTLDGVTWSVRFLGYANGFTPAWDAMGKLSRVKVSASGILRRVDKRKTPLKSPLNRASVAAAPFGFWPCEDGKASTQAASGLPNGTPLSLLRPTGTAINPVPANSPLAEFAKTEATAGSDKIVYLGDSYLYAPLAGTVATSWRVDWVGRYDKYATGAFTTEMLRVYADPTSNHGQWRVAADNVDVYAYFFSESTGAVVITGTGRQIYDGLPHHFGLVVEQNGVNIDVHLYMDGQQIGLGSYLNKTLKAFTGIQAGAADNYLETAAPKPSVGHIGVWDGNPVGVVLYPAAIGYVGETATDRLTRLCNEERVPIAINGTSDTLMGVQGIDTLAALLRECEVTDDGVLYDGRAVGLSYTARTSRYNAATALTVDAAAGQLVDPFIPVDDDQRTLNKATVRRKNGSSATVEDFDGPLGTNAIGTFDGTVSPDPNYSTDDPVVFRASWEVRKGTVEADYRHPTLSLDLLATSALAASWLAADVSSRIGVTNVDKVATNYPPADIEVLLEGWAEVVAPNDWTAGCNCSPFDPWRVGVVDDEGTRVSSGSSALTAGVAAGAMSLSVSSAANELWSTDPADYPRQVSVGGVTVNVAAVSGAASPQTFTVDPVSHALSTGWKVDLRRPTLVAL